MSQKKKKVSNVVDDEARESEEEDLEEMFESAIQRRYSKPQSDGRKRDQVVNDLIRNFSSMISWTIKEDAVPDRYGKFRNEDKIFAKLPNSSVCVVKAQQLIKDNDDPASKDFVIFVAKKKWAYSNLRPLLELCKNDDSITAMRCCKLAITLLRGMEEKTWQLLTEKKKRKDPMDITVDEEQSAESKLSPEAQDEKRKLQILNAVEQLSSLIEIKEALCTPDCNEAIVNLFRIAWSKEINLRNSDLLPSAREQSGSKRDVATCLFYVRRILAIEALPQWCSPAELVTARKIHNLFIIQLRTILNVVPAICADISDPYHDDWVKDIIMILSYGFRNFSAEDMIQVFFEGKVLPRLDFQGEEMVELGVKERVQLPPIVVPESLKRNNLSSVLTKGKLSSVIEKSKRSRELTMSNRHSRFGGVFSIRSVPTASNEATGISSFEASPIEATSQTTTSCPSNAGVADNNKRITSNPLGESKIPQAKTKRNKKNMTFAAETLVDKHSASSNLSSEEGQKACVVMASIMERLTSFDEDSNTFPGIRQLIHRVNEDRRRDEMMISNDLEILFFQILSKSLRYHRLKALEAKKSFEEENPNTNKWTPNFKNIINSFDKMSLTRVVTTMERLYKLDKNYRDVVHAMEVYNEQICYLKLFLQSSVEAYNFVALAGLYLLFYSSSSKLDPLSKLLSSWKPGLYDKHHLEVLIDLVRNTLETLSYAQEKYRSFDLSSLENSSNKEEKEKGSLLYISSCVSFDVDEYFKRLVSNSTIILYTRMLKEYQDLSNNSIDCITVFLNRLLSFSLEQRYPLRGSEMEPYRLVNSSGPRLSYLCFHIAFLRCIGEILNDFSYCSLHPNLADALREIVQSFFEAAKLNHLLLVEVLFSHPHPHHYCELIDNVYEASTYLDRSTIKSAGQDKHREDPGDFDRMIEFSDDDNEDHPGMSHNNFSSASSFSETNGVKEASTLPTIDLDGEEEYNSDDDRFKVKEKVSPQRKRKAQQKRKVEDDEDDDLNPSNPVTLDTPMDVVTSSPVKRRRNEPWTEEEDQIIRDQYPLYAGTESVFDVLSLNPDLRAIGKQRSSKQVEKRVLELRLHENLDQEPTRGDDERNNATTLDSSQDSLENRLNSSQQSLDSNETEGELMLSQTDSSQATFPQDSLAPWERSMSEEDALRWSQISEAPETPSNSKKPKKSKRLIKKVVSLSPSSDSE